jgi:hypothetical protein
MLLAMLQALEHRRSTNDASCFGHLGGYRMDYLASFFAAAFLCNCIPHLACGLRGETFPTPFANPRGKGPSTSIMNFLWGAFNLLVPLYLLSKHPVTVSFEPGFLALVFGALAIGFYLSLHFGKAEEIRKLMMRSARLIQAGAAVHELTS